MPIPQPHRGESEESFLGRCMADATMAADFPDREQRFAVCAAQLGGEKVIKQTTASRDLRQKLELERYLQRALKAHNQGLTRDFIRRYATSGVAPALEQDEAALRGMLTTHYERVKQVFGGQVNGQLPSDLRLTGDEQKTMDEALAAYFTQRSQEQARYIHQTTVEDQQQAVAQAREEYQELSIQETAVVAGAILARWFRAREQSTAITETQGPAEAVKATEAEVLEGVQPSVVGGSRRETRAEKTWDSVGDDHVRPAHLAADGQTVAVNRPFIVGGEPLMFPGDTSRGASLSNIINCRCGSTYDVAAIAAQRQNRG